MEVSFEIEGLEQIAKASRRVQANVEAELRKGLFASAQLVERDAKKSIMSGPKTGRIYRRRSVTHQASAPGEAPANDTGRLVNSITSYLNAAKGNESFVVAGRGLTKYARWLEFGTAKLAARPFLFPALERMKGRIKDRLAAAVRKGVSKNVGK